MTIEKFVLDYLVENGMFEHQAKEVIELAKKDEILRESMVGRWSDDLEGYPPRF